MSLSLEDKKAVVAAVSAEIAKAQTLVIAEYRGVAVAGMTRLRKQARESGVYLKVLKNTLARRAVEGTSFSNLAEKMAGPLVYSISEDPIAAAKVLYDFSKKEDKLVIKAASLHGKMLDSAEVSALANIPSREELLSKLVFLMQSPLSGLARALSALAEKRSGGLEEAQVVA